MGGHRKASKRQRKQKDRHSLKTKATAHVDAFADGFNADSNALILPAKPGEALRLEAAPAGAIPDAAAALGTERAAKTGEPAGDEAAAPAQPLSKSQQRKLRKIQEEKARREQRAAVLQTLAAHQLLPEEHKLLRPLAALGQRETKKQALRRALQLQRAGVELPSGVQLLQERHVPPPAEADMEEASGSSGSDEDDMPDSRYGLGRGRAAAVDGDSTGGSGSESEDEGAAGQPPSKRQRLAGASAGQPAQADGRQQQQDEQERLRQLRAALEQAKRELGGQLPGSGVEDGEEGGPARRQGKAQGMGGLTRVVAVQRRPEIQEIREGLPITSMEQEVMEAVMTSDVVVLCGETGCGKTTQVPQFLYEAGFGCRAFPERAGAVGVTQPRRVAAVSTAQRVADELDSPLGRVVGYQVRYDKRVGEDTAIKFMTDGILLRELQEDFLLSKYSAILIDEAHERSLNTDILCGMLSRIVTLRRSLSDEADAKAKAAGASAQPSAAATLSQEPRVYPLKLIIMSATLATGDFMHNQRLFPSPPPLVSVPARQYPVTVHFSKRTELHDYTGAAFRKARQIHTSLPPGGILVFLTGQREVDQLVRRLRAAFGSKRQHRRQQQEQQGKGRGGGQGGEQQSRQQAQQPHQQLQQEQGPGAEHDQGGAAAAAAAGVLDFEDALGGGDAAEADAAEAAAMEQEHEREMEDLMLLDQQHDDYDAESSGDEEEVVVLGGGGFTPEQIAEAEKSFEERVGISLSSLRKGGSTKGGGQEGQQQSGKDGSAEEAQAVGPMHVLPLYAALPPGEQARVFKPPPPGHRLVIVATNVAETSLTIPGIRYVVDAGRSKQRLLEGSSGGLARFQVRWISKASAEQRAGRAGRTGPGHCYRLYSSAHFNDTFPAHTPPEILNTALEGVALSLKALGVDRVANFPFPTPPDPAALQAAERCLISLGALELQRASAGAGAGAGAAGGAAMVGRLTDLGRRMARYPISPRHARMLLEASSQDGQAQQQQQQSSLTAAVGGKKSGKKGSSSSSSNRELGRGVLAYAIALAAAMSVESPFVSIDSLGPAAAAAADKNGPDADGNRPQRAEAEQKEAGKKRRQAAAAAHAALRVGDSDALSALCALCVFEEADKQEAFCRSNYLHFKNLREAAALRQQLARTLQQQQQQQQQQGSSGSAAAADLTSPLPRPPPTVMLALRRAVAAGWADQVARRIRSIDYLRSLKEQGHSSRAVRYSCCALEDDAFLHPNSALHRAPPEYVAYTELIRTSKRPYMAGVTAIEPQWLPDVAAPLCTFSAPLPEPPPFYQSASDSVLAWRDVTFGRHDWQLPRSATRHPALQERCAVFGAALLEGRVLPSFAALRQALALPPSMLARPDTRVHKRAGELLAALETARVESRASLAAKWATSPRWLQLELGQWLQKGTSPALLKLWPTLLAEAGVEG